jgi:hypothetical protein
MGALEGRSPLVPLEPLRLQDHYFPEGSKKMGHVK